MRALVLFGIFAVLAPPFAAQAGFAAGDDAFLGRWGITVAASDAARPRYCWLELTKPAGELKGRFNQGGGAVFPLPVVRIENSELTFEYPQGRPPRQTTAVFKARLNKGRLQGTAALEAGAPRTWTGVRAPKWPATPPRRKEGKSVQLFNGKDTSNWLGQIPDRPLNWDVKDGVLVNGPKANNIYTSQKFNDFKLHVEFRIGQGSNSGVYLRGRYEIQIADSGGRTLDVHSQGSLYGFTTPPSNVEKLNDWQTFDITLVANRLTVVMNGTTLMENEEVPGITGGALDADESAPGPIMLQGDHGKVEFRKVTLTPLI